MEQHKKRPLHTQVVKRRAQMRTATTFKQAHAVDKNLTDTSANNNAQNTSAQMHASVTTALPTEKNNANSQTAQTDTKNNDVTTQASNTHSTKQSNNQKTPAKERHFIVYSMLFGGFLLMGITSGVAYFAWQNFMAQQAQWRTQMHTERDALTTHITQLQTNVDKQQKQLATLNKASAAHYQEIVHITEQLLLTKPQHIVRLQVMRFIEAAQQTWRSEYDTQATLALLYKANNALQEHALTQKYEQLHLALLSDIQTLSALASLSKQTLIRQLDAFTLRTKNTIHDRSFAENTHSSSLTDAPIHTVVATSTTQPSLGDRLLAVLNSLVVVRKTTAKEQMNQSPQAFFMLQVTTHALLTQARFALMHNNFYYAQRLLSELQKQLSSYQSLTSLNQTLVSLSNATEELEVRSRITLHSYQRMYLLSAEQTHTEKKAQANEQQQAITHQSPKEEQTQNSTQTQTIQRTSPKQQSTHSQTITQDSSSE